jgi:hypothetical protein
MEGVARVRLRRDPGGLKEKKEMQQKARERRVKSMTDVLTRRGMRSRLYPFQLDGLVWMLRREKGTLEGPRGGILADESMLGKSLQVLGLMICTRQSRGFHVPPSSEARAAKSDSQGSLLGRAISSGASRSVAPVSGSDFPSAADAKSIYVDGSEPPTRTLVVVGNGCVHSMVRQFDFHMEAGRELSWLAWEGHSRCRDALKVGMHDVVVTDVATLRADVRNVHRRPCPSVLAQLRWKRLVLDGVPLQRCQDALDAVRQLSIRNAWCLTSEDILHPEQRAPLLALMELLGASMSAPTRPANTQEARQHRRQGSRMVQLGQAEIDHSSFVLRRTIAEVCKLGLVPQAVASELLYASGRGSVSMAPRTRWSNALMKLKGSKSSANESQEPIWSPLAHTPIPSKAAVVYVKAMDVVMSAKEHAWYADVRNSPVLRGYPIAKEFVRSDLPLRQLSPRNTRSLGSSSKLECLLRLLSSIRSGEWSDSFTRYSGRCRLMGELAEVDTSEKTRVVIAALHRKSLAAMLFLLRKAGEDVAWAEDEEASGRARVILVALDAGAGTGMCLYTLRQFAGQQQRVLVIFDESIQVKCSCPYRLEESSSTVFNPLSCRYSLGVPCRLILKGGRKRLSS